MKISVIIPTYKPQSYLQECLDSLCCQTLDKNRFEVLLVLNGPEQPYRSDIEEYLKTKAADLDAKVIYTEISGVSNARNIGIEASTGDYLTFIDDDDYISATYLQELYDKAEDGTITLSNVLVFNDSSGMTVSNRMNEIFDMLSPNGRASLKESRRMFFTACMKLIPKAIIGKRRFDTSLSIGEDCMFMFLISDRIRNVNFTSENAVYHRRVREGSALTSFNRSAVKKFRNCMELIFRYTAIWLSGMRRYSFHFYLTRVRGAIYSLKMPE